MCYICSCCAWSFDFLQRILTFLLTCCLCVAVCFGLTLAIVAGIAYGYNYSMAEWLTFTRSDITVYMRRGQFYDKPELGPDFRRAGADYDLFDSNITTDYEDQKHAAPSNTKALGHTWVKTQDARAYAEKLTKFSPQKIGYSFGIPTRTESQVHSELFPTTTTWSRSISIKPSPSIIDTTMWQKGTSQIVMRNFEAITEAVTTSAEELSYQVDENELLDRFEVQEYPISSPKADSDDSLRSYVPIRAWATTTRYRPTLPETHKREDVDDDIIIYKPV